MGYEVIVKEIAPEHLASVRGTYRIAVLPLIMHREFSKIVEALQKEGIQPSGGVLAIYRDVSEDTVDVEFAVTIRGVFFPINPKGDVKASMVPGGKVAFTVHVGAYEGLRAAYEAIMDYAKANDLELADMMWEKYLTDPAVEADLSKHVTEVYWPLK